MWDWNIFSIHVGENVELGLFFSFVYSQVPFKRVGPNKREGWIFIKHFCLSLCLFLSSCFFGAK